MEISNRLLNIQNYESIIITGDIKWLLNIQWMIITDSNE